MTPYMLYNFQLGFLQHFLGTYIDIVLLTPFVYYTSLFLLTSSHILLTSNNKERITLIPGFFLKVDDGPKSFLL